MLDVKKKDLRDKTILKDNFFSNMGFDALGNLEVPVLSQEFQKVYKYWYHWKEH